MARRKFAACGSTGDARERKAVFEHINAVYKPLVDEIFFDKECEDKPTQH
jgi:hypothetical protein